MNLPLEGAQVKVMDVMCMLSEQIRTGPPGGR